MSMKNQCFLLYNLSFPTDLKLTKKNVHGQILHIFLPTELDPLQVDILKWYTDGQYDTQMRTYF